MKQEQLKTDLAASKSTTNGDKSLDVLQLFQENPHLFVSRAAQAHDISQGSIFNILQRRRNIILIKLLLLKNLWKTILIKKFTFVKN